MKTAIIEMNRNPIEAAKKKILAAIQGNKDTEQRFVKGAVWVDLGGNFSREDFHILRRYAQGNKAGKAIPKGNRSFMILTFKRCRSIALSLSVSLGAPVFSNQGRGLT